MFERVLKRMHDRIRARQYVVSVHAEEEMDDDDLTIFDIEHGVLTGTIVERQKDGETGEWKYLIQGLTFAEEEALVVTKLSPTGRLVILTVYCL